MNGVAGVFAVLAALISPAFAFQNISALSAAAAASGKDAAQKYQCLPGYVYKVSPGENGESKVTSSVGADRTRCVVLYCDKGEQNCKNIGSRAAFTAEQHADWGYIPSLCPTVLNCDGNNAQQADAAISRSVGYAEQKVQSNLITAADIFPGAGTAAPAQQPAPVPSADSFSQIQSFADRWDETAQLPAPASPQASPPQDVSPLAAGLADRAAQLQAAMPQQGGGAQAAEIQTGTQNTFGGEVSVTQIAPPQPIAQQVFDSIRNQWETSGIKDALGNAAYGTVENVLAPLANYFGPHTDSAPPTVEVDTGALSQDYLDRLNQGPMPALDPVVVAEAQRMQNANAELMHPSPAPVPQGPRPTFFGSVVSWLTGHGF